MNMELAQSSTKKARRHPVKISDESMVLLKRELDRRNSQTRIGGRWSMGDLADESIHERFSGVNGYDKTRFGRVK